MLVLIEFFAWWYGRGWQETIAANLGLLKKVQRSFSIPVLLKTLFSPWKQIVTIPGRSLNEKMQALLDNLISRVIGFWVRFFSLIAAAVLSLFAAVAGLVMIIFWPLIPLLAIFLIINGIV